METEEHQRKGRAIVIYLYEHKKTGGWSWAYTLDNPLKRYEMEERRPCHSREQAVSEALNDAEWRHGLR